MIFRKPRVVIIKRRTPLTHPEVQKADVVIRTGLVIKDRNGTIGRLPTPEERKLAVKIDP